MLLPKTVLLTFNDGSANSTDLHPHTYQKQKELPSFLSICKRVPVQEYIAKEYPTLTLISVKWKRQIRYWSKRR